MDLLKQFKIKKENWDSHETDLYILPEDYKQKLEIITFLNEHDIGYEMSFSNVEGQAWYGKVFIDIPFYLLDGEKKWHGVL